MPPLVIQIKEITKVKQINSNNNPANTITKSKVSTALRQLINTNYIYLQTVKWVKQAKEGQEGIV